MEGLGLRPLQLGRLVRRTSVRGRRRVAFNRDLGLRVLHVHDVYYAPAFDQDIGHASGRRRLRLSAGRLRRHRRQRQRRQPPRRRPPRRLGAAERPTCGVVQPVNYGDCNVASIGNAMVNHKIRRERHGRRGDLRAGTKRRRRHTNVGDATLPRRRRVGHLWRHDHERRRGPGIWGRLVESDVGTTTSRMTGILWGGCDVPRGNVMGQGENQESRCCVRRPGRGATDVGEVPCRVAVRRPSTRTSARGTPPATRLRI